MDRYLNGDAARTRFSALLDRVEAAYREMSDMPSDEVGNHYRTQMAERLETNERLNRALMYRVFDQIAAPPTAPRPHPRSNNAWPPGYASPSEKSPAASKPAPDCCPADN